MVSYDTSLAPAEEREGGFSNILGEALGPYLAGCRDLSQNMEEIDKNVFVLNCLLAAESTLQQFSFTTEHAAKLDVESDGLVRELVGFQHNFLVHTSGLHPLLTALHDWDPRVYISLSFVSQN